MVSLTAPIAFLVGGGITPTLIGLVGYLNSFGTGIALVGGVIFAGTILAGHLRFDDSS